MMTELPPIGAQLTPHQAMSLAIHVGREGVGFVAPNPLVGCVIVDRDHRLLAYGHHAKLGGDHAEIAALKKLSSPKAIEGSHIYVTLEPCAHEGRTPSCAKTLAPLKPASVTYAVEDPNPLVAGKGAAILREAGVRVDLLATRTDIADCDELIERAEQLAEIFLHVHRTKSLFVAMKVATSLDGQMAMTSGESKWITGEAARDHVQHVRARYDAVAVGHATFLADDPSLDVRHAAYKGLVNKVVLFDFGGLSFEKLPTSKLMNVRPAENIIVVTGTHVGKSHLGVRHLRIEEDDGGHFEMRSLLEALKSEGLSSIMIEGGAYTFGAFLEARAVQRLHVYVAPILIGGRHGISWSRHFGGTKLSEKIELKSVGNLRLGADQYWTAKL